MINCNLKNKREKPSSHLIHNCLLKNNSLRLFVANSFRLKNTLLLQHHSFHCRICGKYLYQYVKLMLTYLVYLRLFQFSLGTKSVQKLGLYWGTALENAYFKYCQFGFSLFSFIILDQFLAKYMCLHTMFFKLVPLQNATVKYLYSNVGCYSMVTWCSLSKVATAFEEHWEIGLANITPFNLCRARKNRGYRN